LANVRNDSRGLIAGVDVGGTKVAVLVVDRQSTVRGRATAPTVLSSPESTVAGIVAAIRQGLDDARARRSDLAAIGLGIPGRVDAQTGVVRLAVNLKWREMPVGERLSAELGVPCFLENDVRVAALGLHRHPTMRDVQNLAYVSVGTGIAAGLVLEGRLYRGSHGMAGEIGHLILQLDGPRCVCGSRGCLEAMAAGPAIARLGQEAVESGANTLLRDFHPVTAEAVYRAAAQGDVAAQAVAARVGRYLAQALQQLVMAYDVDRIVLGGGVSAAGEPFLRPIERELDLMREDSPLVRELLGPDLLHPLPTGYEAGTWGAVTNAARIMTYDL
jgi:glucokinase